MNLFIISFFLRNKKIEHETRQKSDMARLEKSKISKCKIKKKLKRKEKKKKSEQKPLVPSP